VVDSRQARHFKNTYFPPSRLLSIGPWDARCDAYGEVDIDRFALRGEKVVAPRSTRPVTSLMLVSDLKSTRRFLQTSNSERRV